LASLLPIPGKATNEEVSALFISIERDSMDLSVETRYSSLRLFSVMALSNFGSFLSSILT
jgi:hypothetical protein